MLSSYSGQQFYSDSVIQGFFLKDAEMKTPVALEDTTEDLDLSLCRDLSSNRLVAIPPNLFLLLEDLLQL